MSTVTTTAEELPATMRAVEASAFGLNALRLVEQPVPRPAMNRAIEAHGLKLVVDRVFALEDAAAAFALLERGGHFGEIVIALARSGSWLRFAWAPRCRPWPRPG
jgi:hypothetical protein